MKEPMVAKLVSSEEVIGYFSQSGTNTYDVEFPIRAVLVGNGTVQFVPFIATSDASVIELDKRHIMTITTLDPETAKTYESVVEQMKSPNVIIPDNKLVL